MKGFIAAVGSVKYHIRVGAREAPACRVWRVGGGVREVG